MNLSPVARPSQTPRHFESLSRCRQTDSLDCHQRQTTFLLQVFGKIGPQKSSFFHLRCPQLSCDISATFSLLSLPRHVSRSMAVCERYDKYSERKWISADLAIRFQGEDMAKAKYANAVPNIKSNRKSRRMQGVWETFTCKQDISEAMEDI